MKKVHEPGIGWLRMKKTGKYGEILKDVLKKQIQGLLDQLYEDVGVHSLLITTELDIVTLGTGKGKMFLLERQDLPQDFYSFCLKASEEIPLVTIEQDVNMPESGKKQNDGQGLTLRDRKSGGNNLKEELNDELNMTGSEQMNITDWLSAVVDMPDGSKQCILCGYGTNYPSNLKRHLNVKHHIGERKAPVQQFRCSYCHYNTTVKCNMQRHLRKVHAIPVTSDTVEDNATVVIIDNKQIDVPQKEDFDISMNDTGISDVEEMKPDQNARNSRKRQHPGDYFSVSEVTEDGSLVDNDSEVKGKQQKSSAVSDIECIYCHMCFADQGVLKQHIDEIHFGAGDSGYTCEHCSKEFRTEFSYRGHLASHINALQCPCGCSFNSNWQLKKHTKRCQIAKDGLEMQKNSNASNEVIDVSNAAVNTGNSADHDNISAESPALMVRLSSVANTMDSRIKSAVGNEKDSQKKEPEFKKQAKTELYTEQNNLEMKTNSDSISKEFYKFSNARNAESESECNIETDKVIGNISVVKGADDESLKDQIMNETCRELEISADTEVDKLEITVFKQEVP